MQNWVRSSHFDKAIYITSIDLRCTNHCTSNFCWIGIAFCCLSLSLSLSLSHLFFLCQFAPFKLTDDRWNLQSIFYNFHSIPDSKRRIIYVRPNAIIYFFERIWNATWYVSPVRFTRRKNVDIVSASNLVAKRCEGLPHIRNEKYLTYWHWKINLET